MDASLQLCGLIAVLLLNPSAQRKQAIHMSAVTCHCYGALCHSGARQSVARCTRWHDRYFAGVLRMPQSGMALPCCWFAVGHSLWHFFHAAASFLQLPSAIRLDGGNIALDTNCLLWSDSSMIRTYSTGVFRNLITC